MEEMEEIEEIDATEEEILKAYISVGDFNKFGEWSETMWFSKDPADQEMGERDLAIMGLGIAGEAGEVVERIKKDIRDHTPDREGILKELGDVIFYAVTIARYYGFKPSDILRANYEKLMSRRERGTERGSGDNR
jgi:NTP pyrophosphatase (non-canonical NTP hydrolase)